MQQSSFQTLFKTTRSLKKCKNCCPVFERNCNMIKVICIQQSEEFERMRTCDILRFSECCHYLVFWNVTTYTVHVFTPGQSQQNMQWIWSSPPTEIRTTGFVWVNQMKVTFPQCSCNHYRSTSCRTSHAYPRDHI